MVSIVKLVDETLWFHETREPENPAIFHDTTYKLNLLSNNIKITAYITANDSFSTGIF